MRREYPPSYVTVPGSGGGASNSIIVENDGGVVGTFTTLKFQGGNFTITPNGNTAIVQVAGGGGSGFTSYYRTTAADGQTFFPLVGVGLTPQSHMVVKNGIVMSLGADNDYTVTALGITFNYPVAAGEPVLVWY